MISTCKEKFFDKFFENESSAEFCIVLSSQGKQNQYEPSIYPAINAYFFDNLFSHEKL